MIAYGETKCLFGDVRKLDVFADETQRDAWLAVEVEPDEGNDDETGPRRALTEAEVRDGFRDEDEWPQFDWITLHAGVRPSGMRFRKGYTYAPDWMDLYDYGEQHNTASGVDWSRDVTLVHDGWSRH